MRAHVVTPGRRLVMLVLAALSLSAQAGEGAALLRERAEAQRPTLLVLGTAHFANPGRDVINSKVDDVLAPQRQAEIESVVEQLAAFKPTHIAVEWPADRQEPLDARYGEYRAGRRSLERGEEEQIGLRLAAELGLPRVHAIDWNGYPPGGQALFGEYDWHEWGQANGHAERIAAIRDPARARGGIALGERSIAGWLLAVNAESNLAESHRVYFDYAMIGDATAQPGANWLGHWYARNLRIFANLVRLSDDPAARILVVYGSGHAYLLRRFARESGAFKVVDVDAVLRSAD